MRSYRCAMTGALIIIANVYLYILANAYAEILKLTNKAMNINVKKKSLLALMNISFKVV